MVMIQSPPEDAIPAKVAACWPKFRLSHTVRTKGYCSANSRITPGDPSGPLSFTSRISATRTRCPAGLENSSVNGASSASSAGSVRSPWYTGTTTETVCVRANSPAPSVPIVVL